MRKRRSRSRGSKGSTPGLATLLSSLLVVAIVLGGGAMGTASFSAGETPRGSSVDVTGDKQAALSLDTATSVQVNSTDPLVNVTNQLGQDVTVTVALRADSTEKGELVLDGARVGNSTSFSLAQGATQTVEIAVANDTSLAGGSIFFRVDASASGIDVAAPDRETQVVE